MNNIDSSPDSKGTYTVESVTNEANIFVAGPLHPIEWAPPPKPEYGYRPTPILDRVFIKPVPKEHKSRLITPDAYGTATDQGFVTAVGPNVVGIKAGDLVLFDRFAKVGYEFTLLDDEGELAELVCMQAQFVFAVLQRVKL